MQPAIMSYGTQAENAVLFDRVSSKEMISEHADLQFVILIFLYVTATVFHSSDAGQFKSFIVDHWLESSFSLHAQRKRSKRKGTNAKNHFDDVQLIRVEEEYSKWFTLALDVQPAEKEEKKVIRRVILEGFQLLS